MKMFRFITLLEICGMRLRPRISILILKFPMNRSAMDRAYCLYSRQYRLDRAKPVLAGDLDLTLTVNSPRLTFDVHVLVWEDAPDEGSDVRANLETVTVLKYISRGISESPD
jgi:hypothetical protein